MLKIVASIFIVVLINLRELLQEESRVKVMAIYFTLIGSSLVLAILIRAGKMPGSPIIALMRWVKAIGLGDC